MVLHKTTDLKKMNPKCQSFKPVSKGILLLLVWSILLTVAGGFIVATTTRIFFLTTKQVMMWTGPWVLLPVAGWIGDSFLGRYRAIVHVVVRRPHTNSMVADWLLLREIMRVEHFFLLYAQTSPCT